VFTSAAIAAHGKNPTLKNDFEKQAAAYRLHGSDQRAEIAVAGEQHDLIDMLDELHRIDREFDAHATLELAATLAVVELFCWLRNDGKAIVVEPIDQWPDRRKFRILNHMISAGTAIVRVDLQ
jgi:hypothetical protein